MLSGMAYDHHAGIHTDAHVAPSCSCSYIILNIVVAIMLEGMINEEADELLPVPRSAVNDFVRVRRRKGGMGMRRKACRGAAQAQPCLGTLFWSGVHCAPRQGSLSAWGHGTPARTDASLVRR